MKGRKTESWTDDEVAISAFWSYISRLEKAWTDPKGWRQVCYRPPYVRGVIAATRELKAQFENNFGDRYELPDED